MGNTILSSFENDSFRELPTFSLLVPCYCEEPFLRNNVLRLCDLLLLSKVPFELIFVEDGSPDNTLEVLKELSTELKAKEISHTVVAHSQNRGRGAAVKTGIRHAKGKVTGFIDIDLENSPDPLLPMVRTVLSGDSDLVVGKRIPFGDDARPLRRLCHLGYRWLLKTMVDCPITDTETGLKVFQREKVTTLLEETPNDQWFWDTELVLVSHRNGFKVTEHPVVFFRDSKKASTVRVFRDSFRYLVALNRFLKRSKEAKIKAQEKATLYR